MLKKYKTPLIHLGLFLVTFYTTTMAGAMWIDPEASPGSGWDYFAIGLWYSIPFLAILSMHEFGHYFTARYYKVDVSLPFYIPFIFPIFPNIGTFGALIRMRSRVNSKKEVFDIGIAGPLAGFAGTLGIMFYGFIYLPSPSYLYNIHPEYKALGQDYPSKAYTYEAFENYYHTAFIQDSLSKRNELLKNNDTAAIKNLNSYLAPEEFTIVSTGQNLLFFFFKEYIAPHPEWVPNQYELYHYPFLFAAYLALFFTALNLIPIGQLDGGHVVYGLFGSRGHRIISPALFLIFVTLAGMSIFRNNMFGFNIFEGALTMDVILFALIYLYFLYFIFIKTFKDRTTTILVATSVYSLQFFLSYFFPKLQGYDSWLLFALLIGRLIGTHHPPAAIEEPLNWQRKALGWLCLVIFILSFTPDVLSLEIIRK